MVLFLVCDVSLDRIFLRLPDCEGSISILPSKFGEETAGFIEVLGGSCLQVSHEVTQSMLGR